MEVKKCDFCGKELPIQNKSVFAFNLYEYNYTLELRKQKVDACKNCYYRLLRFIKNNKRLTGKGEGE
jgi:hypothetical protein